MTKKSLINNILAVTTLVEGVCALVLVDTALKNVPMNKVIKSIGRSAIDTIVYAPFAAAATAFVIEAKKETISSEDIKRNHEAEEFEEESDEDKEIRENIERRRKYGTGEIF